MNKTIGVIGLGKMGAGIVQHLLEKGWTVHGFDQADSAVAALEKEGMKAAGSPLELVATLSAPKLIWLMVPAGKAVDEVLFGTTGIAAKLAKDDVVIDGGNSFYKDSIARAAKLEPYGIKFIDVGFSGGPSGARNGGCLMIGGDKATYTQFEQLFRDLAIEHGYQFFSGAGAGHFVKMVHNGIEYGMMQAIGEGFAILKKSPYLLDLKQVAGIYNRGSVIESRLVAWVKAAFEKYGDDLDEVSGSVGHTGEGEWTAKTAKELEVPAQVIADAFAFRVNSEKNPSYTGKVVAALRNQFGGHSIKKYE